MSERPRLFIALTVLANGFAGLAGAFLPEGWLRRRQAGLVGFAAGALIAAAFLDALPQALDVLGRNALGWALAGFVPFAVIEWLGGHRRQESGMSTTMPGALLVSDALHNVADGAAIAAGFLASARTGLVVAVAV